MVMNQIMKDDYCHQKQTIIPMVLPFGAFKSNYLQLDIQQP